MPPPFATLVPLVLWCLRAGIAPAPGPGATPVPLRPRWGDATPVTASVEVGALQRLAGRGLGFVLTLRNAGATAVTVANPLYYTYLELYNRTGRQVHEAPMTQTAIICGVDGRNYAAECTAALLPLAGAWAAGRPVDPDGFYRQARVTLPAHGTLRLAVRVPNMRKPPAPGLTYATRLAPLAAGRYRVQVGLGVVQLGADGHTVRSTRLQAAPLAVRYGLP